MVSDPANAVVWSGSACVALVASMGGIRDAGARSEKGTCSRRHATNTGLTPFFQSLRRSKRNASRKEALIGTVCRWGTAAPTGRTLNPRAPSAHAVRRPILGRPLSASLALSMDSPGGLS